MDEVVDDAEQTIDVIKLKWSLEEELIDAREHVIPSEFLLLILLKEVWDFRTHAKVNEAEPVIAVLVNAG